MFLKVLIFGLMMSFAAFVYFQIIRPLIDNTVLFPIFQERSKVEKEIVKTEEKIEVKVEKKKLNQLKQKAK